MSALKLIYSKLRAGEVFGKIEKHRLGGTYFWETLYIGESQNRDYIFWRNAGSSAETVSLENLKWVITEIFRMTPEEFLYEYTTYHKWVKIDNAYESKDVAALNR